MYICFVGMRQLFLCLIEAFIDEAIFLPQICRILQKFTKLAVVYMLHAKT